MRVKVRSGLECLATGFAILTTIILTIFICQAVECQNAYAEEAYERPYAKLLSWLPDEEDSSKYEEIKSTELPVPEDEWTDESKLWLARSVLGEVGWRRFDEFTAVAWVYAIRAKKSRGHTFLEMIKRYSAAVRTPGQERSPWLFELDFTDTKPSSWPVNDEGIGPLWEGLHSKAWLETLEWADEWAAGKRPNTCPGANHFGGSMDVHRAEAKRWKRIKCKVRTRNRFYTSYHLVPREETDSYKRYQRYKKRFR